MNNNDDKDIILAVLRHFLLLVLFLAACAIGLLLCGCSTPTRVITTEPTVLHDTIQSVSYRQLRDSIYIRERVETRGDTIYDTRYIYTERTRRDTISVERIVERPVEVPKPYAVEVERKEPLLTRMLKCLGVLAAGFLAGYIVKWIRK